MSIGTPTNLEGAAKPSSVEWDGYDANLQAHKYTDNGLAWASVKTVNGLANASIKTLNGATAN